MSFASKAKNTKSPVKPQAKPRTQKPSTSQKPLSRVDLLGKAIANLKMQQEMLKGVAELSEKMSEFTMAEGEVKALQERLSVLDNRAQEQINASSDSSLQLPDFRPASEDELRDLRKCLSTCEAQTQSTALKGKVDIKTTEVLCKEEVVQFLRLRTEEVQKTGEEWKEQSGEFVKSSGKTVGECVGAVEGMIGKFEAQKEKLIDSIAEGLMRQAASGTNLLSEEVGAIVSSAVKGVQSSLVRKYEELELSFAMEVLALKAQLTALKTDLVPRRFGEGLGLEDFKKRYGDVEGSVERLETQPKETIGRLLDAVETVEKNIQDTSGLVDSFLSSSPQTSYEQTEVSTQLNSLLFQVDMLRRNTSALDQRVNGQLIRVKDSVEKVEEEKEAISQSTGTSDLQSLPSLLPRISQSLLDLPPSLTSLKAKVTALLNSLKTLWTRASHMISLPDEAVWEWEASEEIETEAAGS